LGGKKKVTFSLKHKQEILSQEQLTGCKNLEQGPMGVLQQWQSCKSLTLKIQPWRDSAGVIPH